VGTRVVVRRLARGDDGELLSGPTGGPAYVDVLGTCTAWGETVEVVPDGEPDAAPVQVPRADIVSGKPVPPRTSVRGRVGVREVELRTAGLWARVVTEPLGEWQLRHDPAPVGRPRRRATSCLAVGDPGRPVPDALAEVERFYAERGRPALLAVEAEGDVERAALEAGWAPLPDGEADLLLGSVAKARRLLGRAPEVAPRERWEIEGPRARVLLGDQREAAVDGDDWAVAEAAVEGDWLGVHGLLVAPEHRRRGLARQAMAALLEWGAEQGARTLWLHVETDNSAARALYEGLGLARHHTMRYLAPPEA